MSFYANTYYISIYWLSVLALLVKDNVEKVCWKKVLKWIELRMIFQYDQQFEIVSSFDSNANI